MRNRHLRYFLAVAEEQSFSRAAAKLHIDASPLARAIGDLEAQLGTQLLIREKGHIRLTNSGEVFREEARRILTSIENAKIRVRSATNGYRGQLRVGLADSLAQPQLTVNDMILAIRHGEIDVGFTMDGEFSEGLFKSALWRERAVVAMPTRHPFLALDRVSLAEALRYPLVMSHPDQCSCGHKAIQQWLNDQRLPPPDRCRIYFSTCANDDARWGRIRNRNWA
ncbi:LysR family transcriptional regulator [Agrobacterium tumefaciens]|uniref:LysR family transcriptional regulator n=1 Tax=Agrobacterium tumefaciens TaxID=358 RepID=UPI001912A306|nr:LysR family transcriptional regulator [Agrobacterium tumefaciens]